MTYFLNPYLRILDEITPMPDYIPSKEEYVAWYKNHYKTIEEETYRDFLMLELICAFDEFKTLVSLLEQESLVIEANYRYKLLDQENDKEVTEWLLKFEKLSEVSENFYCIHFEWFDDKIEGDKIIVHKELGIKIELSDFKEFIVFEEVFRPLLIKHKNFYCTDELVQFNNSLQNMIIKYS